MKESKNNEFIFWLKEIEINKLNKDYENYISKSFKDDFLNLSIKNLKEIDIKNLNNSEKEWLENLIEIKNFFSSKQMFFNKTWKYKVLYFLYGGFIYIEEYFVKKNLEKANFNFFVNEENVKWFAFKNGPITNHYNFLGEDEEIFIDFKNIGSKIKKILEDFYLTIKDFFSTQFLIDKSHETDPWIKAKFDINKKWQEINKKEIINYFRKTPPFYMKEVN